MAFINAIFLTKHSVQSTIVQGLFPGSSSYPKVQKNSESTWEPPRHCTATVVFSTQAEALLRQNDPFFKRVAEVTFVVSLAVIVRF